MTEIEDLDLIQHWSRKKKNNDNSINKNINKDEEKLPWKISKALEVEKDLMARTSKKPGILEDQVLSPSNFRAILALRPWAIQDKRREDKDTTGKTAIVPKCVAYARLMDTTGRIVP